MIFININLFKFFIPNNTQKSNENDINNINTKINNDKNNFKKLNLQLEIADTPEKREKGLMYKTELCQDCGILFIFEKPEIATFWMKNTYISLDIIFIDENWKIDSIHQKTTTNNQIIIYRSTKIVKYVLEVNAGFSEKNKLEVGQILQPLI